MIMRKWLLSAAFMAAFSCQASAQLATLDQQISVTPTVQNAAYSSGNAIGGLQTISFFRNDAWPAGILDGVMIGSKGGSTTAITLYIFDANPTGTTCTDKSAFSLGAGDIAKLAVSPITITPAVTAGATASFGQYTQATSIKNSDAAPSKLLYICPVVGGAVTPPSTTDLVFTYSGVMD